MKIGLCCLLRIRFPGLVISDKRIEYKEYLFFVIFRHHGYLPNPTESSRTELASSPKVIQFGIGLTGEVVQRYIEHVGQLGCHFHGRRHLVTFVTADNVARSPHFLAQIALRELLCLSQCYQSL